MPNLLRFIGSLKMAVPLLVAIAAVLAWGTIYETRFGTAAVQRFIYQAGWFQGLLAFLAMNLAVTALRRQPWKRRHIPFLLAHLGIILILAGGIVGGRFGVEGQMVIAEGEASSTLQLAQNVLVVHLPNPGAHREFLTRFETTSWIHHPHALFEVPLPGRPLRLVVDRYYPNAERREEVSPGGEEDNPAVQVALSHEEQEESVWLFASDPERFGVRWGGTHVFLLRPTADEPMRQLLDPPAADPKDRGRVGIELPDLNWAQEIPVPLRIGEPIRLKGTPYEVTFKDYFSDFGLSEAGPVNRSDEPNNPAVALTLKGPEGTDAHLLFSLYPEFDALHGREHRIHAHLQYHRPAQGSLPPDSLGLIWLPDGTLAAVLTDAAGGRKKIQPVRTGEAYTHPSLGIRFRVAAAYPRAKREEHFVNRDNEVRQPAIHVTVEEGRATASTWLALRESARLAVGKDPAAEPVAPPPDSSAFGTRPSPEPGRLEASAEGGSSGGGVVVEYRPAMRELPFAVRLLDFRKIDYPGTEMAAGFESDVELTDPARGVTLRRKISMNNPLKHRGFSLFQSSFIQGPFDAAQGRPAEVTILSVRRDPGTPLVYAGFLVIIAGVTAMFVLRARKRPAEGAPVVRPKS